MAPILSFLIFSGSKKKEPRYECLSEAMASLTQNVDRGFLLSTTFPTNGVITQPFICKCLLKVLCPVSRPITTLHCVLLKDNGQPLWSHGLNHRAPKTQRLRWQTSMWPPIKGAGKASGGRETAVTHDMYYLWFPVSKGIPLHCKNVWWQKWHVSVIF